MTDRTLIPLSQLYPSKHNVRRQSTAGIEALAENIASNGLIHNLTVIRCSTGKTPRYEVTSGGRRLQALKRLAKAKRLASSSPVPCLIVEADTAVSVSLAENVMREAMHPADEFEAFARLVDAGKDEQDIADQYGVSVTTVRRRLLLARVSPKVIAAYREEVIDLDQVMALTLTADHALQEQFIADTRPRNAWDIRRQLSQGTVPASDGRARFVGLKAYAKAGGTTLVDMFARDGHDAESLEDEGLLERLALAKLEKLADALREQWAWVEVRTSFDYSEHSKFTRLPTVQRADTAEEAAQRAALIAKDEAIAQRLKILQDVEELSEAQEEQWDTLNDRQEEIESALEALDAAQAEPHPDAVTLAGAVVYLNHAGKPQTLAGVVRPQDKAAATRIEKQITAPNGSDAGAMAENESDPAAIRAELTAARTAAIQDAMAQNVPVALRLLAYQLASSLGRAGTPANVHIRVEDKRDAPEGIDPTLIQSMAGQSNAGRRAMWESTLPEEDDALFMWCMDASDKTVSELLAYCTAAAYDSIERFANHEHARTPAVTQLLAVDMADHYRPTAANYFGRIKKSATLAAIESEAAEGLSAQTLASLGKMKRAQLAQDAETRLTATRWLPATLRL